MNAAKDLIDAFKEQIDGLKQEKEVLKKRLYEAETEEEVSLFFACLVADVVQEIHKTLEQKEKEKNRAQLKAWLDEHQAEKEEAMRIAMLQQKNRDLEFEIQSVRLANTPVASSKRSNSTKLPKEEKESRMNPYVLIGVGGVALLVGYFIGKQ